jgi:hypothetical protein
MSYITQHVRPSYFVSKSDLDILVLKFVRARVERLASMGVFRYCGSPCKVCSLGYTTKASKSWAESFVTRACM